MRQKKQLVVAIFLLFASFMQAQDFGIQAGFLQTIGKGKTGSNTDYAGTDTLNGFKVGLVYEQKIWKGLGLSTGINYSFLTKQGKWIKQSFGFQQKTSAMAHYISVPLHLQYKFQVAKDTYITPFAGPEFSYGVSYTTTTNTRNTNLNQSSTIVENYYKKDNDGDGIYDYSPFNVQLSVGLGIQFQHYLLKGGYDFGIWNINKDGYDNTKSTYANWYDKRSEWNIRLIYLF